MIFTGEIDEFSIKLWQRIYQQSRSGASQCGQSRPHSPTPSPPELRLP